MTAPSSMAPPAPSTASGPTARSTLRRARGPVLVLVAVVLVLGAVAALTTSSSRPGADPRSYSPQGTHALAALLGRRGTAVQVVTSVDQAREQASPRTLVVVVLDESDSSLGIDPSTLGPLADAPGGLVVTGAGADALTALRLPAIDHGSTPSGVRAPACDLAGAQRAGAVRLGGEGYVATGDGTPCYASGGGAGLLALPQSRVLLGSGDFLTNDRLGQDGDAALGLSLLGHADAVLWLVPDFSAPPPNAPRRSLVELLPNGLVLALLQLAVAILLLALWKARRLGRVVVEPLPVVVRAAETVEGRGRLYRATRARAAAAAALRETTRDHATRRLGLPSSGAGLVDAAAARTGRPAAEVTHLLYGPVPVDDAALVRLAADLTRFDSEVSGT